MFLSDLRSGNKPNLITENYLVTRSDGVVDMLTHRYLMLERARVDVILYFSVSVKRGKGAKSKEETFRFVRRSSHPS